MNKTIKSPNYRRQRLLLYFLECLSPGPASKGVGIPKTDLQKLLLLYSLENGSTHYNFVPWKRGGHSFQCETDLNLLEKRGWIREQGDRVFLKRGIKIEHWAVKSEEREKVQDWLRGCTWRGDELVKRTYQLHPYYAFHSSIKANLLNAEELEKVERSVGTIESDEMIIFTIGYEGINFETYLNKLISNHIAMLCDVRHNPLSRKFGFSASMLSSVLPKLNIKYRHFPGLGVVSERRRELNTQADYKLFFQSYSESLMERKEELESLKQVIEAKRRVALTCFEANSEQCHRHCISNFFHDEYHYRVEHL